MRVLPLALATLLLLGAVVPMLALGDDDDFEEEPRTVEVEEEPERFRVRSRGLGDDEIRVEFRADDAELRLEFVPPDNDTVEVDLRLRVESLLEFADDDGDGRFDLREAVIQELEVDVDLSFEGLDVQGAATGCETGCRIAVNYTGTDGLAFGLVFHIVASPLEVNGVRVVPTEVKFDVLVTDFPFAAESSALALVLELETEVEPRANFTGGEGALLAAGERYAGFFRWNATVLVDGEERRVGATVVEVETELEDNEFEVERRVALAYPQGAVIVHDPSVGVARAPLLPPPGGPDVGPILPGLDLAIFAGAAALGALFVAGTVLLRRRRP